MKGTPVAIIGAGPIGLTTGLLLAEYGVRSVILERYPAPADMPRAIILDDEGARVLQCFGLDRTYVSTLKGADGTAYFDDAGEMFARVGAGPEVYGYPKRFYIHQPQMEAALHAAVAATPLCEVRFGKNVRGLAQDGGGVTLQIDGADDLRADWVVAADGARSATRTQLGIGMQGSSYAQDWLVLDTLNDPDPANFTRFICSAARPHVLVPAPDGGKRYEFMMLPGETHEEVLTDAFLRDLLAPYRTLETDDLLRKTVYTFHARIADQFRDGRVLLAGDAAHLTPPFAGQGMNAGLRDAGNIAWKLAAVLQGGAGSGLLDSYFDERRDPAWSMIQLAVAMGDVVMPETPEKLAFREHLLEAMAPFPAVQDYLLKMKFKPKPRYDAGVFIDLNDQPYEASLVGEMIPQPEVETPDGPVKLDALLGNGFALVAQDRAGAQALENLHQDRLGGLPLAKVVLDLGNGSTGHQVSDPCAKPLRTHRDQIMLIRPDRYCAGAFAPPSLPHKLQEFEALLASV